MTLSTGNKYDARRGTEDRGQMTENGIQNTEFRTQNSEQKTEDPSSLRFAEAGGRRFLLRILDCGLRI
jgi:hypothetical protein